MVFQPGQSGNPEGRKKGSKDKYTLIKHMILDAVVNRKDELDTVDMKSILTFVSQTIPKENRVIVDKPVVISWEGEDGRNKCYPVT